MNRARWDDAPNGLWIASETTRPGGVRHLHDHTRSLGSRLRYWADLLRQQGYAPEHIITTTTKDPTT